MRLGQEAGRQRQKAGQRSALWRRAQGWRVRIAIVPVTHSNGIEPSFLSKKFTAQLKKDGLTAYVGPDNGYVLTFSNGFVVYMSGDSGISADQDVTVRGFYGA